MQSAIYVQLMGAAFSAQQAAGIQNTYLVQVRGHAAVSSSLCCRQQVGHPICCAHAHDVPKTALLPLLQVLGDNFNSSNWCSKHPDAVSQAIVAEQLIQFIDEVLPAFGNSTLVND